jgi:DNA-binding MarR family transcriptional regulator
MNQARWLDKERRQKWLQFMEAFYPEINPQSLRLMDELGFVARALYHAGEESLEDAGLSLAQHRVLMHLFFAEQIDGCAELNPSEISERQRVSRNTMSSLIRNLEDDGLVERRLDPQDRRRFNISVTERGRALIDEHMHSHLEMIDRCFGAFDAAEQASFLALLHKLGAHVADVRHHGRDCRPQEEE